MLESNNLNGLMISLNGIRDRKVAFPFHLIENGIRKEQNEPKCRYRGDLSRACPIRKDLKIFHKTVIYSSIRF